MKLLKSILNNRNRRNKRGFTLLELLVVVAILAAIAGTAAMALQDTDARAAAAAHVAMMDELNKGVATFRVLNRNTYPDNFDSLAYVPTAAGGAATALRLPNDAGDVLGVEEDDIIVAPLSSIGFGDEEVQDILNAAGITQLRYIVADATGAGQVPEGLETVTAPCDPTNAATGLQASINSRRSNMVAGNIYNGPAGNGCGRSFPLTADSQVAFWGGSIERVIGPGTYGTAQAVLTGGAVTVTGTATAIGATAPVLMAVGFGPSASLFNTTNLGGMTSVPVYRHVTADQYQRFIGLFHVADATATSLTEWSTPVPAVQVTFVAVVDGAGDTKEEELGEWDGTRNTV
jgi:prepilin-type N-terminal cleavage/methylation domain-containing protein